MDQRSTSWAMAKTVAGEAATSMPISLCTDVDRGPGPLDGVPRQLTEPHGGGLVEGHPATRVGRAIGLIPERPVDDAHVVHDADRVHPAELASAALDVLEQAVADAGSRFMEWPNPAIGEINRLFEHRGIWFRFSEMGTAEWHGDAGVYEDVVQPALNALSDPRLVSARQEYEDALRALRRGGREGAKNAIRDASNAVETTMKALLDACRVSRPPKESADNLWDALRAANVVAEKTKEEHR